MAAWSFVKQNWLALCSLAMSLAAVSLSYVKLRRETRPLLHVRMIAGRAEIENLGPVTAVNISLRLIERVRRPSGKLSVTEILRPGEKAAVSAYDYPEAVKEGFTQNCGLSFEAVISELAGEDVKIPSDRIASYLLSREGNPTLIIRYREVDGFKRIVRVLSPFKRENRFTQLKPSWKLFASVYARFLERRYGGNSEFAMPSSLFRESGDRDVQPRDSG